MTDKSILFQPAAIAVLLNEHALEDFKLFVSSLKIWNTTIPLLYIYCTKTVNLWLQKSCTIPYKSSITLEPYANLTRKDMETRRSTKGLPNLFYDFTQEKCDLLAWALRETPQEGGVLFCDVDLVWLAPLPSIPTGKTLALSRHMIRENDEAKFGKYNAGLLWTSDPTIPQLWKEACKTSRFFEQAALEDLETKIEEEKLYLFGMECNYGWWRMFQSATPLERQQADWSIHRDPEQAHSGILVKGQPLVCIHTHFKTTDFVTREFNTWVLGKLSLLKSQSKVKSLLKELGRL
jgi:hypothetical protein